MSANKNVYFEVTTRQIVKAPNKAEALRLARTTRKGQARAQRIPAATVRRAGDEVVATAVV